MPTIELLCNKFNYMTEIYPVVPNDEENFFRCNSKQLLIDIRNMSDIIDISNHGVNVLKNQPPPWYDCRLNIFYNDKQMLTWLLLQLGDVKIKTFKCVTS